jgi:hypothetical protein
MKGGIDGTDSKIYGGSLSLTPPRPKSLSFRDCHSIGLHTHGLVQSKFFLRFRNDLSQVLSPEGADTSTRFVNTFERECVHRSLRRRCRTENVRAQLFVYSILSAESLPTAGRPETGDICEEFQKCMHAALKSSIVSRRGRYVPAKKCALTRNQ